jgi:hypothetical protein
MENESVEPTLGIGSLHEVKEPTKRLCREILERIDAKHPSWKPQKLVTATVLARETHLARGTVTVSLSALVTQGVLQSEHGRGYRVINNQRQPLASTVISVSEFCQEQGLACVSVLDHDECRVVPLRDVATPRNIGSLPSPKMISEALSVGMDERMLVIRRARAFRRKGSTAELGWAILETLFLIEKRLPDDLEGAIKRELQAVGSKRPLGNFSIHRWMTSNGIELERSEYSLTLAPLIGRDAEVWKRLEPRSRKRPEDQFIRLRAVTYGRRHGPLLYTQECLVPEVFDLGVTGFRFRLATTTKIDQAGA